VRRADPQQGHSQWIGMGLGQPHGRRWVLSTLSAITELHGELVKREMEVSPVLAEGADTGLRVIPGRALAQGVPGYLRVSLSFEPRDLRICPPEGL